LYPCYVHPDHWGDRIGHALLTRIEDRLRDREFTTMVVPVLAANDRARQFYADHGYTYTRTDTIAFANTTLDEAIHTGTL
jgi:GNAT superfamily N-acetyltransferase